MIHIIGSPKHTQAGFSKWEGRSIHVVWFCKVRMIVVSISLVYFEDMSAKLWNFFGIKEHNPDDIRHIGTEQNWRNKPRRDEGAPFSKLCLKGIPQSHTSNTPYLTHSFCIHIVLSSCFESNIFTKQPTAWQSVLTENWPSQVVITTSAFSPAVLDVDINIFLNFSQGYFSLWRKLLQNTKLLGYPHFWATIYSWFITHRVTQG